MRRFILSLCLYVLSSLLHAQTGQTIIDHLKQTNQAIADKPATSPNAAAISNRAMNIFLADKTGYLSASTDLSFYTNYVTLNSAEGKVTVNHNFQKASGADEPIKSLFGVGFDMTMPGSYAKYFLDKRFEQELGLRLNYTWLGKVHTRFANGSTTPNGVSQKQAMDALRASILQSLELEVQHKEAAFIKAIEETDSGSLRGQDHAAAKALMLQQFYQDLYAVCEEQFASAQAAMLTKTNNFRLISTGWTSMGIYMPLVFPDYSVASSLSAGLNNHHPYPFNVTLGHTRIWESAKMGRLFVSLNGGLLLNNTKLIYGLNKLSWTDYKNLGGTDTLRTADEGNHKIYIGPYKTFLTPAVSLRLVYFLPDSHIGCSFLTEQNFGTHNMLNIKLGIPVVLINSKKTPAVTIECYAVFYNVSNKASNADKQGRPWLGLSAGIPFSRLMY